MKTWKPLRILAIITLTAILAACLTKAKAPEPSAVRDYTDPGQLAALLAETLEPYVLVDVRTPDEYMSGHIPTAINIPYDKIAARLPTTDASALVIVYCASGGRAALATKTLRGLGYTRVVDFGAIGRWEGQTRQGEEPGACPCR